MEPQLRGTGGALDQLGQLGLSDFDLLQLAANGGLNADAYMRSHSAEVARAQQQAQQSTFAPSWPPYGHAGSNERGVPPQLATSFPTGGLGAGNAGNAADLSYLAQLSAATGGAGSSIAGNSSSAAFGEGPRIYVGGVPDLVTVAMVRDHFSRWGVAAERAVAESNREIGGYPVAAINIPTDRLTHYGLRQATALASPTAALRNGMAFSGGGSPGGGIPNGLAGLGAVDPSYASPTRSASFAGAYNVTHQVGAQRIRGTSSAEFMPILGQNMGQAESAAASQLAVASERDLAAALAALRMSQAANAANGGLGSGYGSGGGSGPPSGTSTRHASRDFSSTASYSGGSVTGMARSSTDYAGASSGTNSLPPNLGAGVSNDGGGDIYTILANMQRTGAGGLQQHQSSPAPSPRIPAGLPQQPGSDGRRSAGVTPLGTPPDMGLHPGAQQAQRPASALDAHQPSRQQAYSYLNPNNQGQGQSVHSRSYSFEGGRPIKGGSIHGSQENLRSDSASYGRAASPGAAAFSRRSGSPALQQQQVGSSRSSGEFSNLSASTTGPFNTANTFANASQPFSSLQAQHALLQQQFLHGGQEGGPNSTSNSGGGGFLPEQRMPPPIAEDPHETSSSSLELRLNATVTDLLSGDSGNVGDKQGDAPTTTEGWQRWEGGSASGQPRPKDSPSRLQQQNGDGSGSYVDNSHTSEWGSLHSGGRNSGGFYTGGDALAGQAQ